MEQEGRLLMFPSLRSQPLWELEEISRLLSASCDDIRKEIGAVLGPDLTFNHLSSSSSSAAQLLLPPMDSIEKSVENGQWNVCYFIEEGDAHQEFSQVFPRTTAVLHSLPLCRCSLGYSYLSILSPGAVITPHAGVTNTKLRIQLPLFNTEESIITVHGREYRYEEGKPLIFDDSFVHSVRNFSLIDSRVVLLIDIWHPDLSPEMISDLSRLYPSPKSLLQSSMNVSSLEPLDSVEKLPKSIRLDPRSTEVSAPASTRAYDSLLKLLLVGDSGAGKSSFITRFTDDSFSPNFLPTIGADFTVRTIEVDNLIVKLQLWEPAGPERFRAITRSYYRGAHAVLLLYDISDRNSFNSIRNHWGTDARQNSNENASLVIVGTKSDLIPNPGDRAREMTREVSVEEGESLANELNATFFMECSNKTGENVEMIVMRLVVPLVRRSETLPNNLAGVRRPQEPSQVGTCALL